MKMNDCPCFDFFGAVVIHFHSKRDCIGSCHAFAVIYPPCYVNVVIPSDHLLSRAKQIAGTTFTGGYMKENVLTSLLPRACFSF
jgi:hypothetical protein